MSIKKILYVKQDPQRRWITCRPEEKKMNSDNDSVLKIRFKFPGGEEFEAEGTREFIEEQRAYFLKLVGKDAPSAPALNTRISSYERTPKRTTYPLRQPDEGRTVSAETAPGQPAHTAPDAPAKQLWERILKTEDGLVFLRRKHRLLTHETAALVLIAGAKTLVSAANGYSALDLSKSMKKSGYGDGRLDRQLAGEIRTGAIIPVGSKRGRAYKLSDEGFARAFVLAEKLGQELL